MYLTLLLFSHDTDSLIIVYLSRCEDWSAWLPLLSHRSLFNRFHCGGNYSGKTNIQLLKYVKDLLKRGEQIDYNFGINNVYTVQGVPKTDTLTFSLKFSLNYPNSKETWV